MNQLSSQHATAQKGSGRVLGQGSEISALKPVLKRASPSIGRDGIAHNARAHLAHATDRDLVRDRPLVVTMELVRHGRNNSKDIIVSNSEHTFRRGEERKGKSVRRRCTVKSCNAGFRTTYEATSAQADPGTTSHNHYPCPARSVGKSFVPP